MLKRKDLLNPEGSYKESGAKYTLYNKLGLGQKEVYYQRALARI
jgi:hypothetical protein